MSTRRGAGSLKLRGGVYWARFYANGTRIEKSTGTGDIALAQKALVKLQAQSLSGTHTPEGDALTLQQAADLLGEYYASRSLKSTANIGYAMAHLGPFFGLDKPVAKITPAAVTRYTAQRTAAGGSRSAIRFELSLLRRALNVAGPKVHGILAVVPHIALPAEDAPRTGYFTDAELAQLLPHCPRHLRDAVRFAAICGWRKSEVLGLRWADVSWEAGEVRLRHGSTKNGEARRLPFAAHPELGALLRERKAYSEKIGRRRGMIVTHVFNRAGRPVGDTKKAWRLSCKRAGLGGRLFHDLRRTAVRNLIRAGVDEHTAMKVTGHKSASVFRRYDVQSVEDVARALAKLPGAELPAFRPGHLRRG